MRFNGIIFDLEGTIFHTKPEYRYSVVGNALKELGANSSNEEIDKFWFGCRRNDVIRSTFKVKPELFWEKFFKYENIEARTNASRVYEDALILRKIKQTGRKIGIIPGLLDKSLSKQMSVFGIELFDSIVPESKAAISKPGATAIDLCISQMGLSKNDVAFAGNSHDGVFAAKEANVYSILVDRKEHSFSCAFKPDITISTLQELRKIL